MFLPDGILICNDKMSMASGLELRVPFLDRELMRFVDRIPARRRVGPRAGKRLHRGRCRGCSRRRSWPGPKHGFATPYDDWLRASLGEEVRRRYAPGSELGGLADTGGGGAPGGRAPPRAGRPQGHPLLPARALGVAPGLRRGPRCPCRRARADPQAHPLRAQPQGELRGHRPGDPGRGPRDRGPLPARPPAPARQRGARRAAGGPRVRVVRVVAHVPAHDARLAAAQALGDDHRRLRHGQHARHRLRLPAGRLPALGQPLDHETGHAPDHQLRLQPLGDRPQHPDPAGRA